MWLDKLKASAWMLAALAAAALLATQTVRLHTEQGAHQALITSTALQETARTQAALKHEQATAAQESTHATATQKASDDYTTSQPVRDAIARADGARLERLRTDAERRASSYRAQAHANAAACSGLADRLVAFDRHIVEGASVVAEHRQALGRRDSEVNLLRSIIDADRALLAN